jgi:hypothetical protein
VAFARFGGNSLLACGGKAFCGCPVGDCAGTDSSEYLNSAINSIALVFQLLNDVVHRHRTRIVAEDFFSRTQKLAFEELNMAAVVARKELNAPTGFEPVLPP